MKSQTIDIGKEKLTVLQMSSEEALDLIIDLINTINGSERYVMTRGKYILDDGHYFQVAIDLVTNHTKTAITYMMENFQRFSAEDQEQVICTLAAGQERNIWNRYIDVKLKLDREDINKIPTKDE